MICSEDPMTIIKEADCVWIGLLLSCTAAVNVDVPLAVGVPEMTPEDPRVNPAGRLPDVTDHV